MADKKIKTRIQQKHDIEANWLQATNFVPMAGEIIVYDVDEKYNYERFKVGDGEHNVTALPFCGQHLIKVTYSELCDLRNSSQLIPGVFYRITDYVCTTTQDDTLARGNRFDIIVQALSENTLSENASADYHIEDGNADGYFAMGGFALNPQFGIREDETGLTEEGPYRSEDIFIDYGYETNSDGFVTPVLYKTDINDYPYEADYADKFYYVGTYELDGTTYDRWRKIDDSGMSDPVYTWDGDAKYYVLTDIITQNGDFSANLMAQHLRLVPNADLPAWELKYCLDNDTTRFAWADSLGTGVIYYMKDEWNNECGYDFKNIQFKRYKINDQDIPGSIGRTYLGLPNQSYAINEDDYIWCYTFSLLDLDGITQDLSIVGQSLGDDTGSSCYGVHDNIINSCSAVVYGYTGDEINYSVNLNNIVLMSTQEYIDDDAFYGCYSNTFGNNCYSNTFGNSCNANTFGNACSYNIFSNDCSYNTFGGNCYSNTFSYGCDTNTFGYSCGSNTFSNECYHNTFGNECYSNTFGGNCYSNTFGNGCGYNTFGNDCYSNTFGNDCHSNTFRSNCCNNKLGNTCTNNLFDSGCNSNELGNDCDSNSLYYHNEGWVGEYTSQPVYSCYNILGNKCCSNKIIAGISNTFGDNCSNNNFKHDCYNNTFGSNCTDNAFGTYCNNNNFGSNCTDNAFGNSCNNNNFGSNCVSNAFVNSVDTRIDFVSNVYFSNDCKYIRLVNDEPHVNGKCIKNVTILAGISGSSSSPLELQVSRNVAPVVFEAAGTTHIILD